MVYTRTITFSDVFDCNSVKVLCHSVYDATFPTQLLQTFVAPCRFGNFYCVPIIQVVYYIRMNIKFRLSH
jgi:hypothetical protein